MRYVLNPLLLAAMLMALTSCSEASGPDLSKALESQLPNGWKLMDFEVIAKEETGTKINPKMDFRFSAVAGPEETLLQNIGSIRGNTILLPIYEGGTEHQIHGTGASWYRMESWETAFRYEKWPFRRVKEMGWYGQQKPLGKFKEGALVVGTNEYENLKNEILDDVEKAGNRYLATKEKLEELMQKAQGVAKSYDEKINASSADISELKQKQREADKELFEKLAKTAGLEEKQAIGRELKSLRKNNAQRKNEAVKAHNELIASRKEELNKLKKEAESLFAQAKGYYQEWIDIQNELEFVTRFGGNG